MRRLASLLLSCLLAAPLPAAAQQVHDSASSVVQLRCLTPAGEMKATGFVWPEPGMVVTALHAVAGCDPAKSTVFSESARRETQIAEFLRVDLEADLALLRTTDDMGLPAISLLEQDPVLQERHSVWGYPLSAEQLVGMNLDFALGLPNQVITLGSAFSSADLDKLFREQDFPTRDTQILRVTSTIQPGHSGAPIFDDDGRIVAIADGGLLGGWRGINWSIPAHVYLPQLLVSDDAIPDELSKQGILHSNVAVADGVSVVLGQPSETATVDRTYGRISFDQVLFELAIDTVSDDAGMFADVPTVMDPQATFLTATDGPYPDRPLIYPETMQIVPDAAPGFHEFESRDGTVRYIVFSMQGDTAAETFESGRAAFLDRLSDLGLPGTADAIEPSAFDAALEFALSDAEVGGDFWADPSLFIYASQNGTTFHGQALFASKGADELTDAAYADYLMAVIAMENLNDLYPLPGYIAAQVAWDPTRDAGQNGALTLVRRVPLSALEAEIVAQEEFLWKSDLSRLRALLPDDKPYADLRFDVYEDRLTGATIAVPEGQTLQWDPDSGIVRSSSSNGMVTMGIAIQRAADFNAAIDTAWESLLPDLSAKAEWYGPTPNDCYLTFQPAELLAECFGEFWGYIPEDDLEARVNVKVTVKGNVSLATFVFIASDEDGETPENELNQFMMLFAAEYLSDFAEM